MRDPPNRGCRGLGWVQSFEERRLRVTQNLFCVTLSGAENETRARVRGHDADFFRGPLSRLYCRQLPRGAVASSSPLYKKTGQLLLTCFGAENETRTRDPNLGKVVLYQLSYFRISILMDCHSQEWIAKIGIILISPKYFCKFMRVTALRHGPDPTGRPYRQHLELRSKSRTPSGNAGRFRNSSSDPSPATSAWQYARYPYRKRNRCTSCCLSRKPRGH